MRPSNKGKGRLLALLLSTLLALSVGLAALPQRAYAYIHPIFTSRVEDGAVLYGDVITIKLRWISDYQYNRFTFKVIKADTGEVAFEKTDRVSGAAWQNPGIMDMDLRTPGMEPGTYNVYVRSSYYTLGAYCDSPDAEDNGGLGPLVFTFKYKLDLSGKKVVLASPRLAYTGKVVHPTVKTVGGMVLRPGIDYTVTYSGGSSIAKGTYKLTVTGKGKYIGTSATATYKILNANKLIAKPKAVTAKAGQTVPAKKAFKVKKATGKVTYKKASGNAKIVISKKGDVKIKKGLKPGTYKVKVKVTAKGSATVAPKTVKVVLKVKVK